jgi:hypothetical protein
LRNSEVESEKARENPLLQRFGHDLAPGCLVVRLRQATGPVVLRDLLAVEQAGKHRGVGVLVQCMGTVDVLIRVIQARY